MRIAPPTPNYEIRMFEDSPSKLKKTKADLVKILKKHGFKRSFFRNPVSEAYTKGDLKAEVDILREFDAYSGNPFNRTKYGFVGVLLTGNLERNPRYQNVSNDLIAYLKEHERKQKNARGLEGKTLVFIGSVFLGIALSLTSITPTGNVIGSLLGTGQGLIGLILFVFGIVGLAFSGKK